MLIEKALFYGVVCVLHSICKQVSIFPGMKPGYYLRLLKAVAKNAVFAPTKGRLGKSGKL